VSPCDRFLDRFYDDDAQAALRGRRPPPQDLLVHVERCSGCRTLWGEAEAELDLFRAALAEQTPREVRGAVSRSLRRAFPAASLVEWRRAGVWGLCGAGLAGCGLILSGEPLSLYWQSVVLVFATSVGLAVELTRQGFEATSD